MENKKATEVDRLWTMFKTLNKDVAECWRQLQEAENQFWRRSYVRSFLALVEGCTYRIKQAALEQHGPGGFSNELIFSPAEVLLLREENFEINDKGIPFLQTKLIPLHKNVRFAYWAMSRAYRLEGFMMVEQFQWEAFKQSVAIRNRLTHPKEIEDLDVSESEIEVVRRAWEGYLDYIKSLALIAKKGLDNELELQVEIVNQPINPS